MSNFINADACPDAFLMLAIFSFFRGYVSRAVVGVKYNFIDSNWRQVLNLAKARSLS